MNIALRLFLLTGIFAVMLFFSACNRQSALRGNQNQNAGNSSQPSTGLKSGYIFTGDERGNSISVIDLSNNQTRKIPISISPHNVQVSADGRLLLAVGAKAEGGGHEHGGTGGSTQGHDDTGTGVGKLLIFDIAKMDAPVAEIPVGKHPAHVVIDSQGKFIYVTNSGDDTVSVIDMKERKIVKTIETGKYPHGLRISPDGREIYVANVNDGTVSVISTVEQKEVASIQVGKTPVQVGFTPDGKRVYVSLRDENLVAVVDTTTRKKIADVTVGNQPIQMYATPDGRFVYVANQGTEETPDQTVSVIDTQSNKVIATITTGKGAHGVAVSNDGRSVFITNSFDDTVTVIDVATQKVVNTIKVGDAPNGITFKSAN